MVLQGSRGVDLGNTSGAEGLAERSVSRKEVSMKQTVSLGMILSAKALLNVNPKPTDYEIKRAIAGNLCRCTGYVKIIEAIKAASLE